MDPLGCVKLNRHGYRERLIREEVMSLQTKPELSKLELLALTLPERMGSPPSLNALCEDLQVSQPTVAPFENLLDLTKYD